jgi:hypothetical protein
MRLFAAPGLLFSRRNVEPWQPPHCCSSLDLRLFTYVEVTRTLVLGVHLLMDHNTTIDYITIFVCIHNTDWGLVLEVRLLISYPFLRCGARTRAYPVDWVFIESVTGSTVIIIISPWNVITLVVEVRISTRALLEASSLSLSLGVVDIDFKGFGAGSTAIGFAGDSVL